MTIHAHASTTMSNEKNPRKDPHMPLSIRPAAISDAAAVARIYNQAVARTTATFDTELKTEDDRRLWLTRRAKEHPAIVATVDVGVAGWGAFLPWSDRCAYRSTVEMSVYVDEQHHRGGVGAALSRELLRLAPEVGIHSILARVCSENTASLAMAERLGFREVGTMHEVGRKFDRWLDVVVLELLVQGD
ncbi:MAG: N-acetyltransferase family protein [Actinomycetota bacterium]|nr:N-acetyltransferase family protein [Actinomycetota bacterium]MDP3629582.1 N-acetyltransferase family protein [Actinomycetota bacterium]